MKIQASFVSISGRRLVALAAAALAVLALPVASNAQQGPINGAVSGAAQGTYQGKTAAGPIGGLVGGAIGAGVGVVTGTLNGVLGPGEVRNDAPEPLPQPVGTDRNRRPN